MTVPMEEEQRRLYTQIIEDLREQQERARKGKGFAPADPEGLFGSGGFGGRGGGGGFGTARWTEAEWIRDSFTRLRKAAQHPLLLHGGRFYSDPAVLKQIARTLYFEGEFREGGKDAQGPSMEHVAAEVRSSSDLRLHEYCTRYAALRSYRLDLSQAVFQSGESV